MGRNSQMLSHGHLLLETGHEHISIALPLIGCLNGKVNNTYASILANLIETDAPNDNRINILLLRARKYQYHGLMHTVK